jgi:hypothetical protein
LTHTQFHLIIGSTFFNIFNPSILHGNTSDFGPFWTPARLPTKMAPRGTCQLGQLRLLRIDPFAGPELRTQSFIRSFEQRSPPWNVAGAHPDHQAARLILKRPKKVNSNEEMEQICDVYT